jgi:hypothetical protein
MTAARIAFVQDDNGVTTLETFSNQAGVVRYSGEISQAHLIELRDSFADVVGGPVGIERVDGPPSVNLLMTESGAAHVARDVSPHPVRFASALPPLDR